jgi:hypothetical protein
MIELPQESPKKVPPLLLHPAVFSCAQPSASPPASSPTPSPPDEDEETMNKAMLKAVDIAERGF